MSLFSFSQSKINGVVKDRKGEPIFATNVYLKSAIQKGVTSDFDGNFSLNIVNLKDTLIVSFIGYETKEIPIKNIDISKKVVIILKENNQTLDEVIITAKDPISEQFSVTKMDMLKDVYLNPVSQGDPLKAITILPASTNTDETANSSLRGSSPNRSRVILNGVPIYNPVRASNISNQGFFSLFNPEVIDNMYVYASNPPLTYGNTSAGLVEIQTKRNLNANQLQLSTSLASTGFFLSQKIKKDISFIQVYGNYQFSDAYVSIQKDKLPNIRNFYTKDAGINFHSKIGKRGEFNSYNYYIDESFNGYDQNFTYNGSVSTLNKRIFTVNNFKYYFEAGVFSINKGTNNSKQSFEFGNIKSNQKTSQIYTSIDYKWYLLENTNIQFGVSHDFHRNNFKDSIPTFYYALLPSSPNHFLETSIYNHNLEAYIYTNWDINDKFTFSSGMRSNIPIENQKYYFSSQLGLKYRLNKKQSFLLSGGKYHNYSIPSYCSKNYNLLSSYQVALDYSYEVKNTLLKAATYLKNETGTQVLNQFFEAEGINTFGLELYVEHNFYKYFKFSLSNSFIDQKRTIDNKIHKGSNDFNYFVKSTIQYNNPKIFSLALTYIGRPGIYYNEITGSTLNSQINVYEPNFSNELYSSQFGNYNRFDVSLSKYIKLKKNAIITFFSINNIFNTNNERTALYNTDYSVKDFNFYQLRAIYFGAVWQLNY
jgi:hypothetical protein